MKIALGLKAHSGWAALVALGKERGAHRVVERCRLELVEPADVFWAKQPYHAAEGIDLAEGRDLVKRGVDSARRIAARELKRAVKRCASAGHEVAACGVLVGAGMPSWSVEQILAVHFRMHKAEGELFREALVRGARACDLEAAEIPEKSLERYATRALGLSAGGIAKAIAALGSSAGAPWGKDQRDAALAAWIALETDRAGSRAAFTRGDSR